MKIIKTLAKVILTLLGIGTAMVVLAGCKSISFERVDGEKVVRGSYYAYGIENNLEGLEIIASPTNGVTVRINRSMMDMSKEHKEIIDSSSAAAGTAVGAAAAVMIK